MALWRERALPGFALHAKLARRLGVKVVLRVTEGHGSILIRRAGVVPEHRKESVALADKNIVLMVRDVGLKGVEIVHYPRRDSDYECCYVLKRRDPRVKDHSQMEVFLTCRVDMAMSEFSGDRVDGRLRKIAVNGDSWLPSFARTWIYRALKPVEEE